jgi:hypothetical protein
MVGRYVAIVTVYDPFGRPQQLGGETVFEESKSPIFTGLLDTRGVRLYSVPEHHPLGFDLTVGKP